MRAAALLVLLACAGTTADTTLPLTTGATVEPARAIFEAEVGAAPVAVPESGSASYLSPIAVLDAEGTRYLAVNGFDDDPLRRGILLYEETTDVWSLKAVRIVVDLDLEAPGPIGSSLVRGGDGSWFLYGWGAPSGEPDSSIVWLARAADLFGEWAVVPEPVLTKGGAGVWDDEGVLFPSVVPTDGGFTMLYDGFGSVQGDHVGLAHSTDGVRWEKHNDPATGGPFEESDPVFGPDPERRVRCPQCPGGPARGNSRRLGNGLHGGPVRARAFPGRRRDQRRSPRLGAPRPGLAGERHSVREHRSPYRRSVLRRPAIRDIRGGAHRARVDSLEGNRTPGRDCWVVEGGSPKCPRPKT